MIEIEYNHRIKQTSIVVAMSNSVAQKLSLVAKREIRNGAEKR